MEGKYTGCEMVVFDWYKDHVLPTYVDVGITQTHFVSKTSHAIKMLVVK